MRYLWIVLLILTGCTAKNKPIRIAINAWPGYEQLFLAQEKGFFEEAGLSIQFIEFGSLGDVQRAFEWGQVNGMACTLIDVIIADYQTNRDPKIVLVTGYPKEATDVLFASDYIKNVEDLKGRHIAVEFRSLGMYLLLRALESHNMSINDVILFPADPTSFPSLFDKGYVDAAVCYPPHSIQLKDRHPELKPLYSSKEITGEIIDVLALESKLIKENPDIVEKILKVWDRAVKYEREHPDEAVSIMASRENLTLEEFLTIRQKINVLSLSEQERYFTTPSPLDATSQKTKNLLQDVHIINAAKCSDNFLHREAISKVLAEK
ncbi:MAG: hypothetical protein A2Y14_01285 [Verrucomicrobia bacterium GWF2_51_19]|nr:MAG: hypothetical protein A2Y14_01285 [Verrucomicrobia bacterium GWF2_51_19]HCJ11709.1 hypothetical protein [Opitutae bacterium]